MSILFWNDTKSTGNKSQNKQTRQHQTKKQKQSAKWEDGVHNGKKIFATHVSDKWLITKYTNNSCNSEKR